MTRLFTNPNRCTSAFILLQPQVIATPICAAIIMCVWPDGHGNITVCHRISKTNAIPLLNKAWISLFLLTLYFQNEYLVRFWRDFGHFWCCGSTWCFAEWLAITSESIQTEMSENEWLKLTECLNIWHILQLVILSFRTRSSKSAKTNVTRRS